MVLRTFVKSMLRPLGLTVIRLENVPQEPDDIHVICRRLGIDLVLDVGANEGQFGVEVRKAGYQGRIVSFEPIAGTFGKLSQTAAGDPLWECRHCALGDSVQSLPMNVSGFTPSSSLLPMADKHIALVPTSKTACVESVSVTSLDTIADELCVEKHKTLLKIDVQGYESAVLRGAAKSLSHVMAAQVELLFCDLYHAQARYFEVIASLERAGLRMVSMVNIAKEESTGYWMWADGIFIRDGV